MRDLLKFITCGSVDNGKSTLIGHMLYDAKLLFADQIKMLELDSRISLDSGKIDYSLLLDGLIAEREQKITIDVAYRYFKTKNRSFIVADTPGHEEYTRNMAVGASFADLAVILIDITNGVLAQTIRHIRICSLMGIKHFVFAVNKMDLVEFKEDYFQKMNNDIKDILRGIEFSSMIVIPVSAIEGDNIAKKSCRTNWYRGRTLLSYLEQIDVTEEKKVNSFIMPVQRVCRPNQDFRGYQGQVEAGRIVVGDQIYILPSKEKAMIKRIIAGIENVQEAEKGEAVTLQLDKEVDISRGDVLSRDKNLQINNLLKAKVLWMDETVLTKGKNYFFKLGTKTTTATVLKIDHKIDISTGESGLAKTLSKNEIAECLFAISEEVVFSDFIQNQTLGSFILIDRLSHMTAACGTIINELSNTNNLTWQKMDITREQRANQKGQKPITIWFTGLSGSGKSTLANELEKRLFSLGIHTMVLDGDNIRLGLNKDLRFEKSDRKENIRRIAEVARLLNDAGLIVIASFISPYKNDRQMAKEIIGDESFFEIYLSTPLEECEKRDTKKLYKKARAGEIADFPGISSVYEIPVNPNLEIDTARISVKETINCIMINLDCIHGVE